MRVEKPIGTFLLLWPTLWAWLIAADGKPNWLIGIVLCLGTFFMRSAGCVINDFADRNFDAHVERTKNRPFALGIVSPKEAFMVVGMLTFLSILCLIPLNKLSWQLSIIAFFVAMTYPFTKRVLPVPQAYLGLAFSFGIPIAFAAQLNYIPSFTWLIFIANISWTIAYDTLYAMADKEDDLKLNIHTSAITFGRFDLHWVIFFHAVFVVLLLIVGYIIKATFPFYIGMTIVIYLQFLQFKNSKGRDREKCFHSFLDNNKVGLVIFIALSTHYLYLWQQG